MRRFLLAAAAAILTTSACAQPAALAAPPGAPKLLVVISVDQFSADLFDEYRPHFSGGLARLAGGTVFRNGYQSHATTETCLGHSTILTGARPARTGIIGNIWFDAKALRTDKAIYCAEDEAAPGTNSTKYKVSPAHLRVETLGDRLRKVSPGSLNVAVAGKDRSAVMMGGRSVDQRWYWTGKQFETDLSLRAVPQTVVKTNAALVAAIAAPAEALEPTALCTGKAQSFAIAGGGKPVGGGRLGRAAGDAVGFRPTPQFDGAVLALAAGLIQEMRLGADAAPDVLSIGLSATDFVGHTYGPGGQEMCLQMLALDREMGDFFARLDSWGLDYEVALTADHGGLDIPERLQAKGVADAAWVDVALTPERLGQQIAQTTGLKGPVIIFGGPSGDIYIDPALQGAERSTAANALLAFYRGHPQVHSVYTKEEIAQTALPSGDPARWSVIQRVRASFDADRSGDLYVVLKPHIQPIADTSRYVSTHGSPWDYDRRVPILFWRRGMTRTDLNDSIETADIMPTLAGAIGLPVDRNSIDGECLSGIAGVTCPSR
jgi:hypothetical protein